LKIEAYRGLKIKNASFRGNKSKEIYEYIGEVSVCESSTAFRKAKEARGRGGIPIVKAARTKKRKSEKGKKNDSGGNF